MDSKTRRSLIAQRLSDDGEASITSLAESFGTSEMTIRRDLDFLELEGLARRIRGGAISVQSRSFEPPILQRAASMSDAKRRIGLAAVALLRDNETIILDGGSTTHEMAKAIPDTLSITVITSSLLIATELSTKPLVRTIVTGGTVRYGEMSLIGPRAQDSFADLNCDAYFIGVAGVSDQTGISEYNLDDAYVKKAALSAARRKIVLADASKINQVAFITIADIEDIDVLITNGAPSNETLHRINQCGVEILHVEPFAEEK
jgi:DeoR/GlpR family transcriptional regulator of sugar metabolism